MKDLEFVQTGSITDRFHKKIGDIGLSIFDLLLPLSIFTAHWPGLLLFRVGNELVRPGQFK